MFTEKRHPDQPVASLNATTGEDDNDEFINIVKGYEIDVVEDFDTFLKTLTPKQRQIVKLRIECGSSYDSIGAIYGVSRQAVCKEMQKIRAKYDKVMKEQV